MLSGVVTGVAGVEGGGAAWAAGVVVVVAGATRSVGHSVWNTTARAGGRRGQGK